MLKFIFENLTWLSVGLLMTFASSFGQTFFISIFANEILEKFSLTHGSWGGLYMLGTLASAATMLWLGTLADVFKVRVLGPAVLLGLAIACIAMATNNVVWLLPIVVFLLRVFGQGMAGHVAIVAMTRWFIRTRGRALAVATLGYAIGESILPMIFVSFLDVTGYSGAWLLAAGLALAIAPVIFFLMAKERTPREISEASEALGMKKRHWRRTEMLKHPLFWLIVPLLLGPPAFGTAFFFLQVHIADVKGWSHFSVVALFPFYTVSAIVAMMISGIVLDKIGTARLVPLTTIPYALGFLIFSSAEALPIASVAIAFMGAASGMTATIMPAFWAEFYGTRFIGGIKSIATSTMVLGSALGPGLCGWLIDVGFDFPDQMANISLYMLISGGIAFLAIRSRSATI